MSAITARLPNVDWNQPFERHWLANSPVKTHAFNALSFFFPQAELFFIDVVRECASISQSKLSSKLRDDIQGFISQEATHTNQHRKYNDILLSMGYKNTVGDLIDRQQNQAKRDFSPLTRLAIVCGYEHYTAILGDYLLSNPQMLTGAQKQMALVWGWHAAEETEHKTVCFDLYKAMGGGWFLRIPAFLIVTLNLMALFLRIYMHLLKQDGCFERQKIKTTLFESMQFFFGKRKVGWSLIMNGFRYLSPNFHPSNQDNREKLKKWLAANEHLMRNASK